MSITKNNLWIIAQGDGVIVKPPDWPHFLAGFRVHADHVTIRGFVIAYGAGCAPGIAFEGSHNTFAENYIYLDTTCVGASALVCRDSDGGSDYNTVEHNTRNKTAMGIAIVAETDDAINTGNIIRNNTLLAVGGVLMVIENGKGFLVSGNSIDNHPHGGGCIFVGAMSENKVAQGHHRIVKNTMGNCGKSGISLYAWPGTVLTHNRISDNTIQTCGGDCLALEAGAGAVLTHNHVISNSVSFSLANGIYLSAGQDAAVNNNLILGNTVFHNKLNGILLTSGADRNRIFNNEVQTNSNVGIAVAGDNNLIVGNWAWNNTTDLEDTGVGNRWRNNTVGE